MPIALRMPALSPTMKDGTLARWCVKKGDKVEPGSLIAEIETDKAIMEFECADEGVIACLLVEEGEKNILVNKLIAVISEEGESEQLVEKFIKENTQKQTQEQTQEQVEEQAEEQTEDEAEDENVSSANAETPSVAAATPVDVTPSGDVVAAPSATPAATPWARRLAEGRGISLQGIEGSGAKGKITADDVNHSVQESEQESEQESARQQGEQRIFASPRAKARAKEASISLQNIVGSGEQGRIVQQDVEKAIGNLGALGDINLDQRFADLPSETPFEMLQHTSMREIIAHKLTLAKNTIPHFYLNIACRLDQLIEMRQQLNLIFKQKAEKNQTTPLKISINDLLVKALALALERRSEANVAWQKDGLKQFLRVDVAVAVAITGGLITPIIKDAAKKPFQMLAQELHVLIEKARAGKLTPQEYNGGTISISNLGMFGIQSFQAIVNPPQAAILAIGAVENVLVQNNDKEIVVEKRMIATLSADHRAIDGAVAAKLCAEFKNIVENPIAIILG